MHLYCITIREINRVEIRKSEVKVKRNAFTFRMLASSNDSTSCHLIVTGAVSLMKILGANRNCMETNNHTEELNLYHHSSFFAVNSSH